MANFNNKNVFLQIGKNLKSLKQNTIHFKQLNSYLVLNRKRNKK